MNDKSRWTEYPSDSLFIQKSQISWRQSRQKLHHLETKATSPTLHPLLTNPLLEQKVKVRQASDYRFFHYARVAIAKRKKTSFMQRRATSRIRERFEKRWNLKHFSTKNSRSHASSGKYFYKRNVFSYAEHKIRDMLRPLRLHHRTKRRARAINKLPVAW